ncbi:MAG: hypothetical protein EOO89_07940 [Pedobacter sp.]|nr:MAG: hypothetical protein EOO89_07940 [Pedobacter sp.]
MVAQNSSDQVISRMELLVPLSPAFKIAFCELLNESYVQKGRFLLNEDELPGKIWYSVDSICREISAHPQTGMDQTSWFWFNGDFIFSGTGFCGQRRSRHAIEVLKDGHVLFLHKENYLRLKADFAELTDLEKVVTGEYFEAIKLHSLSLASLSNQARYDAFVELHQDALLYVNHKHVTSFLGIHSKGLTRYSSRR